MAEKGLLDVAHRIVTDKDFQQQFLVNPKETLADLGLSEETVRALIALAPVLATGGMSLVAGAAFGIIPPDQGWGRP